ncbi:ferric uptake regulation protein Fur [Janthinobacterium sp. HH01]|uniref:Ferric uptake regulation protein n=2 Tax=Rugamonas TaxID=212744 RepID=A0A843SHN2_9BURK|nr:MULTISPECIES: ferric iron uptake transcriptional regulator [Oxalobacteraceae]ELX08005.1 ferric uptake regulation protein Fur [Janthinobacterium sp. HH01]MQA21620.1 ferric iron uptake transcriptional regulator [Rugamonas rivuli]MQA39171.1 ferric iron uptake transcriptional regulator [Rugamonas aquatica]OEZ60327.1 ferric uptake regulation protein [Duganella sp. HH105]
MDIPQELRKLGLKATLPRLRILQLFQESKSKHLNADDVYRLLHAENIDMGLATVYRVLMQFADAGILIRRHFESVASVFELNEGGHHDHLICTNCGRMEEFLDAEIEQRQEAVARERNFVLHEHSLSLYGFCGDCAGTINPLAGRKLRRS